MDFDDDEENVLVTAVERSLGVAVFTEESAPANERCGEELHVGPTGVWVCQRAYGHHGPCWATGTVEVPDA